MSNPKPFATDLGAAFASHMAAESLMVRNLRATLAELTARPPSKGLARQIAAIKAEIADLA